MGFEGEESTEGEGDAAVRFSLVQYAFGMINSLADALLRAPTRRRLREGLSRRD